MTDPSDTSDIRREYAQRVLARADIPADPWALFDAWLEEAIAFPVEDATAMALATADAGGMPSVRIVLLKGHSRAGLTFFTDTSSQKGQALNHNPRASVAFYWRELERQLRVSGEVERVSEDQADHYFNSRPLDSRLSASISHQSQVIESREALEERFHSAQQRNSQDVTRPSRWGGYLLKPSVFEFWQGRVGRLHDRFQYTAETSGDWQINRLQP